MPTGFPPSSGSTPPSPSPPSAACVFETLLCTTDGISAELDRLEIRLGPVLAPTNEKNAMPVAPSEVAIVGLASRLESLQSRLSTIVARIRL